MVDAMQLGAAEYLRDCGWHVFFKCETLADRIEFAHASFVFSMREIPIGHEPACAEYKERKE